MKKFLWFLLVLLIIFLGLVYISLWGTNKTFETATIVNIEAKDLRDQDSVLVITSTLYDANPLKRFMQGNNYREAWKAKLKIPVVYLDTLLGGMKIIKEGGGSQTHSLRLQNSQGILYSLRSVNKDPSSHIPELADFLGLENIVIDGISAQHPYGAIAAAALAEVAQVQHTHPKVVFVPKQKFLAGYNDKYGNRLFLLEYETEGNINWTNLSNVKKIIETDELQQLKSEVGEKLQIDENAYIRARLFDMLIGDWDRHAEQWGWILVQEKDMLKAIPLAGDRDNAFFKLAGVIPTIISHKYITPMVRPFEKDIDYMPGLVYPLDVYLLKNVPQKSYLKEAEFLQQQLTNEKIIEALKVWPKVLYDLDGEEIVSKIIKRRNDLLKYAREFHEEIEQRDYLSKPLKGSEDLKLQPKLIKCFDCE